MSNEFYIAPKAALDATADAIRAKTGSQASIEFTQDGFADAIEGISTGGITIKDAIERKVTGDVVLTVTDPPPASEYTFYAGLFYNNKISSLTVNGLLLVPGNIASQSSVGPSGSESILTSVSFPNATHGGVGGRQFLNAKALVTASFPSLTTLYYNYTTLGDYFFGYCWSLTTVDIGNVDRICANMFRECKSLTLLELKAVNNIQGSGFLNASSLATIIIRSNAVPTLANTNAFNGTPFASGNSGGTFYVPSSLISSYQSASNWSTILGYADNQIKSIESTHTDPNAPIDLTLYYADGTLIPT